MSGRSRILLAFHLAGLCAWVCAQPLFTILGESPEFFVAHRAGGLEIVLVVAAMILAVPAAWVLIVVLVDRFSRRAGSTLAAFGVGVFAAAFALQILKRTSAFESSVAFPIAAAAALGLAILWWRSAAVGTFLTIASVGTCLFPVLFVSQSAIRKLVWPAAGTAHASVEVETRGPVVFVMFDQLPLVSLLGSDGQIERAAYPNFAALAERSTWYRDITTVNPVTGWALPAVLTGVRPREGDLPVLADHPDNLFTLLAPTHAMHVAEPITSLCPEAVCHLAREGLAIRVTRALMDLSIVYLHVIVPNDLAAGLPSVTQDWRNFAPQPHWQALAGTALKERSVQWQEFVDGIQDVDQATLHFVHILLPHDPWVYLPTGNRYTYEESAPGLVPRDPEVWLSDEWAVTEGYRRHLLQVGYADRLLGSLISRLEQEGMFDKALIVVTADHGAVFRSGQTLRDIDADEPAALMSTPLFIKRPFQREGEVDDRNMETVDILPTVADILGATLPWATDGESLEDAETAGRPFKEISYTRVTKSRRFDPWVFGNAVELAKRKERLFPSSDPVLRRPALVPHAELIGRRVDSLAIGAGRRGVTVAIRTPERSTSDDPSAPFLPVQVDGWAEWATGEPYLALAVVVDGVIQATARTYESSRGDGKDWSVLLPLSVASAAHGEPEVFVLESGPGGVTLHPIEALHPARLAPPHRVDVRVLQTVNLISDEAVSQVGVKQSGLYDNERMGDKALRWTNGLARLVVPVGSPRQLRVSLLLAGATGTDLGIRVNGCSLFADHIPNRPWERDFDLAPCGKLSAPFTIEIESGTVVLPGSSDTRTLGVALERVLLR